MSEKRCKRCGELCDEFAGNPGKWPVPICLTGSQGVAVYYHQTCLAQIVEERDKFRADIDKYRERLEVNGFWQSQDGGPLKWVPEPYNGVENDTPYDGIFCRDETIRGLREK